MTALVLRFIPHTPLVVLYQLGLQMFLVDIGVYEISTDEKSVTALRPLEE